MAVAMTEEMSLSLQKGLSEWWSEETEYVFQRIERWAAFARGYNRLRSQRLSRGRLTMQEEQEPRWSISSNKIVIEDPTWSPRFHNLKRSHRRKSRTDENCKINCCGTFNYQSNSNLDSTCLETYRYDHSIYFKTIGDIKSSKKDLATSKSEADDASCFSDEQLEWEAKAASGFVDDPSFQDDDERIYELANDNGNHCQHVPEFEFNIHDFDEEEDDVMNNVVHNVWPIFDLTKLSLTSSDDEPNEENPNYDLDRETQGNFVVHEIQSNDNNNNDNDDDYSNCNEESGDSTQKMIELQIAELTDNQTRLDRTFNSLSSVKSNQEGITRILSFKKQRRSPRRVKQPTLVGENNVTWPGVLLNYTKNLDPANSPHHQRAVHVK